jgi:hypothetical protein
MKSGAPPSLCGLSTPGNAHLNGGKFTASSFSGCAVKRNGGFVSWQLPVGRQSPSYFWADPPLWPVSPFLHAEFPRDRVQAQEVPCNHSMAHHGEVSCNLARSFPAAGAIAAAPAPIPATDKDHSLPRSTHRRSFCRRQNIQNVRFHIAHRLPFRPSRRIISKTKEDMSSGAVPRI